MATPGDEHFVPKTLWKQQKLIQERGQELAEHLGHQGITLFQLTSQSELFEEERWKGIVSDHNPWLDFLVKSKRKKTQC